MLPSHVRILLCTEPQDFRKSFDGLALVVRQTLGENPQSGTLFGFFNKRMNRLKWLWWDETGYCLLYKRLHRADVRLPASAAHGAVSAAITSQELVELLRGAGREDRSTRRRKAA